MKLFVHSQHFSSHTLLGIWVTRTTRMPVFWYNPSRPMITHTSNSHQIRSQNKTTYKLQIHKIAKILIFKFCKKLYKWHTFWSCLIRYINMKSNQNCKRYRAYTGCRMDGQTDGRSETNIIPSTTSLWYNNQCFYWSKPMLVKWAPGSWKPGL